MKIQIQNHTRTPRTVGERGRLWRGVIGRAVIEEEELGGELREGGHTWLTKMDARGAAWKRRREQGWVKARKLQEDGRGGEGTRRHERGCGRGEVGAAKQRQGEEVGRGRVAERRANEGGWGGRGRMKAEWDQNLLKIKIKNIDVDIPQTCSPRFHGSRKKLCSNLPKI